MPETNGFAALATLPAPDQAAIGRTLTDLLQGFAQRDADRLRAVYSADADWVNAFGTAQKGRDAIVAYLRGLFADPNFDAGRAEAAPDSRIRVLTGEVVVLSMRVKIAGQKLVGGGVIPERDNHSLHVLQRQPDGSWLIVSEMYMDARRDQTYVAPSER
jgi:uncharacterized protein (TIGR02246 family)